MTTNVPRAVIVGASSLLGKELAEELNRASGTVWDLVLVDTAETAGQMTAAGDEAFVIQPLAAESFAGASVVFFAADGETTRQHWKQAFSAGASVVDLSGVLTGEPGVRMRAPLLASVVPSDGRLDLATEAVVAPHAVSLMLGYVAASLRKGLEGAAEISATVLLPASEFGKEGMDELHAQTVALLSFQSLPREVFDAQVAFNLNAELGSGARPGLEAVSGRVANELKTLLGNDGGVPCAFRCAQAAVFHGCSASVFLKSQERVDFAALSKMLERESLLTLAAAQDVSPNDATANEENPMQGNLREDLLCPGSGWWLWLVADNLRLQARNAVSCARELLTVRPDGTVQ